MRSHVPILLLITSLFFALAPGCQTAAHRETQLAALRAEPIDPAPAPLIVTLNSSGRPLSLDEFHYLKQAVAYTFNAQQYPGKFEVRRSGAGAVPEDSPVLAVRVLRWGPSRAPGITECQLSISLTAADGRSAWLGSYTGEDTGRFMAISGQQIIDSYTQAATRAMLLAYADLQPCFRGAPPPAVQAGN